MLILEILYLSSALLLAIYGLNSLLLTWIHWRHQPGVTPSVSPPAISDQPYVTIQLPVYNERHVVGRLFQGAWLVARRIPFDYAQDRHRRADVGQQVSGLHPFNFLIPNSG